MGLSAIIQLIAYYIVASLTAKVTSYSLQFQMTYLIGTVYNFDFPGVCEDLSKWDEVISIPVEGSFDGFEQLLLLHVKNEKNRFFGRIAWMIERSKKLRVRGASRLEMKIYFCRAQTKKYQQLENNCYDFVIRFLNSISYQGRNDHMKGPIVEELVGIISYILWFTWFRLLISDFLLNFKHLILMNFQLILKLCTYWSLKKLWKGISLNQLNY